MNDTTTTGGRVYSLQGISKVLKTRDDDLSLVLWRSAMIGCDRLVAEAIAQGLSDLGYVVRPRRPDDCLTLKLFTNVKEFR